MAVLVNIYFWIEAIVVFRYWQFYFDVFRLNALLVKILKFITDLNYYAFFKLLKHILAVGLFHSLWKYTG